MDMGYVICCLVVLGVIVVILGYRGDKHADEIRKMKASHREAQAEINRLDDRLSTMSTRQTHYEDTETQATRLLQEQIALKMDAMDACKAMLRESWRNH